MNDLIQWPRAKYWTGTFNPVVGCRPVSEGCEHCYAESVCNQYGMNGAAGFAPTAKPNAKPPKSGVVFVGNMTDIFGEWNKPLQIEHWLSSLSDNAFNLVLTKRSSRMKRFFFGFESVRKMCIGVTGENQRRFDERFDDLRYHFNLRKWLSLEPLLGPVKMGLHYIAPEDQIDWVVVGAESIGSRAGRPCKLEWVESIVGECLSANVPVFVKQLHIGGKLVKDITKFPAHLQIRQVPWTAR